MADQRVDLLRRIDVPATPPPDFADELFATLLPLALEATARDARPWGAWLAAVDRIRWAGAGGRGLRGARVVLLVAAIVAASVLVLVALWSAGHPPPRGTLLGWKPPTSAAYGTDGVVGQATPEGLSIVDLDTGARTEPEIAATNGAIAMLSPDGERVAIVSSAATPEGSFDASRCQGVTYGPVAGPLTCLHTSTDPNIDWADDGSLVVVGYDAVRRSDDTHISMAVLVRPGMPPFILRTERGEHIDAAAWSTRAGRLAVVKGTAMGTAQELDIVDPDGGTTVRIDGVWPSGAPVWSADGSSVFVGQPWDHGEPPTGVDTVRIDTRTGATERVASGMWPVMLTPAGDLLATSDTTLVRLPVLGGPAVPLATGVETWHAGRRLFSGDGRSMLAYVRDPGSSFDVFGGSAQLELLPLSGGPPRRIADGVVPGSAEFSRDGAWISFVTAPVTTTDCGVSAGCAPSQWAASTVWIVRPDGTDRRVLLPGTYAYDW